LDYGIVTSIQQVLLVGAAALVVGFVWNGLRKTGATGISQVVGVIANVGSLIGVAAFPPPLNALLGAVPIATILLGDRLLYAGHGLTSRAGVWHTYRRLFRDVRAERAVPPSDGAALHARVQRDKIQLERWRTDETSALIDLMSEWVDLATTPGVPNEELNAAVARLEREMRGTWGWPINVDSSAPPG
jgi:hypothetical protein